MKAKFVFETLKMFKRSQDVNKSLDIGHNKKMDTKAWKVLEFIGEAGEEGRSLTEIQKFIFIDLNGRSEEEFYEKSRGGYQINDVGGQYWDPHMPGPRRTRGYWTTALYYTGGGLLNNYCEKNENDKWVLRRYPERNENFYN